jgi:hypothetical protein
MLFHYGQQLYFPHLTEILSGICPTDRERNTCKTAQFAKIKDTVNSR